jgi:hypothetical protein
MTDGVCWCVKAVGKQHASLRQCSQTPEREDVGAPLSRVLMELGVVLDVPQRRCAKLAVVPVIASASPLRAFQARRTSSSVVRALPIASRMT